MASNRIGDIGRVADPLFLGRLHPDPYLPNPFTIDHISIYKDAVWAMISPKEDRASFQELQILIRIQYSRVCFIRIQESLYGHRKEKKLRTFMFKDRNYNRLFLSLVTHS